MSEFDSELLDACKSGDLKKVRELVESKNVDPGKVVEASWTRSTPLHYASEHGNLEVVKYLVDYSNCNVNATDGSGWTPLHWACREGHLPVVKLLVEEYGCDVAATGRNGITALHNASERGHLEMVEYLLENSSCNVNAVTSYGDSPLHWACAYGHLEVVKFLVNDSGCDLNQKSNNGSTPLDTARLLRHLEVVTFLEEQAINDTDSKTEQPLEPAVTIVARSTTQLDNMKCPVCHDIQADPCTLQCGHTTCQLCLAGMWKYGDHFCPVCKEPWQALPSVNIDHRNNIESSYGDNVTQLKRNYSQEEKELIDELVQERFKLRSITRAQTIDLDDQIDTKQDELHQEVKAEVHTTKPVSAQIAPLSWCVWSLSSAILVLSVVIAVFIYFQPQTGDVSAQTSSAQTPANEQILSLEENHIFRNLPIDDHSDMTEPVEDIDVTQGSPQQAMPTETFEQTCSFQHFKQVNTLTEIEKYYDLRESVEEIGDWLSLCKNLKVEEGIMNRLKDDNNDECLKYYVNSDLGSWEEVVMSVARPPFKNKRLAKKITQQHVCNDNKDKIFWMLNYCSTYH